MRSLGLVIAFTCAAFAASASDIGLESCLFSVTENAGIPGYNEEVTRESSAAACMDACSARRWCKSVDYERATGTCYLQPVDRHEAALDHNYSGDPYDHFSCETRTRASRPAQETAQTCKFVRVRNAGIPGHNQEVFGGVTAQECRAACRDRDWCKSVDYERGNKKCFLQPVNMNDVALKTDYVGSPYDHYSCVPQ